MVNMKLSIIIVVITFVGAALAAKKYHLSESRKNWWKALDSCMNDGMVLASISSKEDEDQLLKQIKDANTNDPYWIGGTNFGASDTKSGHYWLGQNKLLTYTNWQKGEPSSPEAENCIQLRSQFNYKWNDGHCERPFHYACEEKDAVSSKSSSSSESSMTRSASGGGCESQGSLQTELQDIEPTTENVPTITLGFESEMDTSNIISGSEFSLESEMDTSNMISQGSLQTELQDIALTTENIPTITLGFESEMDTSNKISGSEFSLESEMDSSNKISGNGLTTFWSMVNPLSILNPLPAFNPSPIVIS